MVYSLLCLLISLLFATQVTSMTYYVTPDKSFSTINNTFPLYHYIRNAEKYFVSNNELCFLPGMHYLSRILDFWNVSNFTLSGMNSSTIRCSAYKGLMIANATNFTINNINFIDCGNYYGDYVRLKYGNTKDPVLFIKVASYWAAIFIDDCLSIKINKINVMVNAGFAGLLVINAINDSVFTDVKVKVNCISCQPHCQNLVSISGIVFYYKRQLEKTSYRPFIRVSISNFQYRSFGLCMHPSHYAMALLFKRCITVYFNIYNTTFSNLVNSSALYYYDNKCKYPVNSKLFLMNVKICNNVGHSRLQMFYINLANDYFKENIFQNSDQQRSSIVFRNCQFVNNAKIGAMIFVVPTKTEKITGYIEVQHGQFHNNSDVHFIRVTSEVETFWKVTTHIKMKNFTVTMNEHHDGMSLISIINGMMIMEGPVVFTKNGYYKNILRLYLSMILVKGSCEFTDNYVRHIISGSIGSYFLITEYTTLNMSNNNVYMIAKYEHTFGERTHVICPIQFYSTKGNLDDNPNAFNCTILLLNNVFMLSKYLPGDDDSYEDCKWIGSSAFQSTQSAIVYLNVLTVNNIIVNRKENRSIPLSICPCTHSSDFNCYLPNLGSLFPGETLYVKFTVSKQWSYMSYYATTLVVANTFNDDCSVVDSHQLSQTYLNSDCNTYEYTIWPSNESITQCTLFVGLREMPEMFYIDIKPCPKGFTQQQGKMACYCDPLLNNVLSITSCNLDDETILRPANSWISADTVNHSHTYQMGPQCPFDYCLPHSSHLNLSNPDSQCQFKRSGMLCGQCQQGQSSVFGSSQCMQCSHIYLFIAIPIAMVGIVLVILLFIFNLTITNGTVNSFIFYVNIISINYLLFYPKHYSIDYILLSLFNLDLGIETCFYNGMDDYAKILLQLAFPVYLMLIAFALIVSSRYSVRIQRLTAHRALPVLSTIFLLSYTKILLTVCRVLFRYTKVIQYPSKESKLVWIVDVSIPLFGVRFLVAFCVCLILFIILLLFNILLLFTRKLTWFSLINNFKPVFDVYFGPYKDKYYYWTGLQLLIRAVFLGLSALNKDISLTSGIIILGMLLCIHGSVRPFKSTYKNYQELLLILNLQATYATALYINYNDSADVLIVRILIMLAQVYIVVYIICHCVIISFPVCSKKTALAKKLICYILQKKPSVKRKCDNGIEMDEINDNENYHEFQEPLVGLDS